MVHLMDDCEVRSGFPNTLQLLKSNPHITALKQTCGLRALTAKAAKESREGRKGKCGTVLVATFAGVFANFAVKRFCCRAPRAHLPLVLWIVSAARISNHRLLRQPRSREPNACAQSPW